VLSGEAQSTLIPVDGSQSKLSFHVKPKSAGAQWVRVNIRDGKGNIEMISNPIYFNISKK
jgi:hypothetical protein